MNTDLACLQRFDLNLLACTRGGQICEVIAGGMPGLSAKSAGLPADSELPQSDGDHAAPTVPGESGMSIFDLLPPAQQAALREAWDTALQSAEPLEQPVQIGSDPQNAVWHLLQQVPAPDRSQASGDVLVLLIPLDRLMRNHLQLAQRAQAVFDTAVDAIITIDQNGIVQSANESMERMFGYPVQELIGKNIKKLMPEPFHSQHDQYLQRYLATGQAAIIGIGREVVGRRQDGTEFPIHLAVSQFALNDERHFTGIIRDLSDLQSVQQQLLQSERLAAIGQMVTGLAHESRNALQRAQAHLDMLSLDLQDRPEELDLAVRTKTALQDLYRLYEEVRGYAAPIQLERRRCDLSHIWRKEWANLQAARQEMLIQLQEDCDGIDTVCEIDVHRIEQVFRNILENAVQACESAGTVRVICRPDEIDGQPALRIDFQDNGSGLTEDVRLQLFEPFFTTRQKGTGLGLAIGQRIVDAHHGRISAESARDGACIRVVLPRKFHRRNAVR